MAIKQDIENDKVIEVVMDFWSTWKTNRKQKEEIWRQCVNNYLCMIDESRYESWPWRSKACDTVSQETADTISASITNALFPMNEEFYKVTALDEESKPMEGDMKDYFDKYLKKSKFLLKVRPFIKQLCVLGNSTASLPWVKKMEEKRQWKKGWFRNTIQRAEKVKYDCFSFQTLDALDTVTDPFSNQFTQESLIITREFKSFLQIKADLSFDKEALKLLEDSYKKASAGEGDQEDKSERAQAFGLTYEPTNDDIELLTAIGDFEIDGERYKNYIAVLANGTTLLRFEENPYWGGRPLIWGTYDNIWFSAYGRGPLEPILGIHELINTFTNQKADILNLIIMGAFAYVDDGITDPDDLVLRPGGGIPVGDINNIKALSPNTNVALAFQEIAMLRGRAEGSSAATDLFKGQPSGGRKTAFETGVLQQGSASRINDIIRATGENVIEYALNFYLNSLQQFKVGSKEIDDTILMGDYRIEYYGAETSIIRSQEIQTLQLFLDIFGRYPVFADALNPREAIEEVRRTLGLKNKKLVKSEQEIQADQLRKQTIEEMSNLPIPQQTQPGGQPQ